MSKTLHQAVINQCLARGCYYVLPEVGWGDWYADYIAVGKEQILEIEIKRSVQDYRNDFNKKCSMFSLPLADGKKYRLQHKIDEGIPHPTKYSFLFAYAAAWKPTHFVYAAPTDIARQIAFDPQRPRHFGVWSFEEGSYGWCFSKSLAPMKRIRRIQPQEMEQFLKAIGKKALRILTEQYRMSENLAS